jgi:hypothetical protein
MRLERVTIRNKDFEFTELSPFPEFEIVGDESLFPALHDELVATLANERLLRWRYKAIRRSAISSDGSVVCKLLSSVMMPARSPI